MTLFKNRQQGSALIIVLILMTVSVSLALYTVSVSRDMVSTSGQLLDNLQARLESGSTLEKLKYIGSTGRFSSWNLGNLSANPEFPLQLNLRQAPMQVGNSELRLQDTAGKLGVWPPNPDMLKKLLLAGGIKPADAAVASDSLLDWVDADDFKHLNGAESYYYRSEQAFGYRPRNDRFIQTKAEIELIKGFRGKIYDLLKDELIETTTGAFNYNTADVPLLAAVFDMDFGSASRLAQLREKKGFLGESDVLAAGGNGLTFRDESITTFPSMKVAVDIRTRINDAGDSIQAIISFRPSKDHPYTVEKFQE